VKVLCQYLEHEGCSKYAPTRGVAKPFMWQERATIFIDFVPLRIELEVKAEADEITVTVKDLSLNDVIRFKRMFNSLLKFIQDRGLSATCKHQISHCFRLLDDDFDTVDDAVTFQNDTRSSSEQVDIMLVDIAACKHDFHEEASISTSASTSTYDSHEEADMDACKYDFQEEASISISASTSTYDVHEEALRTIACWSTSNM